MLSPCASYTVTKDFCDTADSLQRQSFQNGPHRFTASDSLAKGICGLIKQMSRAVPNLVLTFPFLKEEIAKLNPSGSTSREVIKSQLSGRGGEEGWADRRRSLIGTSSQPLIQSINTAVTHHNFYPTLTTGYVFSMREIQFVKTPAFTVKKTILIFWVSPLEGLVTCWKCVANASPKWYVLWNRHNLSIIVVQQESSKTSLK